ncbi:hypothetical protein ACM66B_006649 [Microbotryomycetes sp. NB124-2]
MTVAAASTAPTASVDNAAASGSGSSPSMALTPAVMNSFKPARVFKFDEEPDLESFTSISFTDDGSFALAAADGSELHILDANAGTYQRKVKTTPGTSLVRCTHTNSAVLHNSDIEHQQVKYLALDEHKYIRSFKGHERYVCSMAVCPKDDTFLTGATDDTVKLWDIRKPNALGSLDIASRPSVAYDPAGMVFAVGLNLKSSISMYDRRAFDQQPFLTVYVDDLVGKASEPGRAPVLTSLQFSNDGSCLLVGTSSDVHFVLDAFDGRIIARLVTEEQSQAFYRAGPGLERNVESPHVRPLEPRAGISGEELSWSPDGRFIISGSIDGKLNIWDMQTLEDRANPSSPFGPMNDVYPLKTLDAHGSPSRVVRFNPRRAMFASGGREIAFWLPEVAS